MYNFTDIDNKPLERPICSRFWDDQALIVFASNFLKYLVVALNYMIRIAVIRISEDIGHATETNQASYITRTIFFCQCFNMCFLVMLVEANFKGEAVLEGLKSVFNGAYADFDQQWYRIQGDTVVGTMVINIGFLVFLELGFALIRKMGRAWD